MPYQMIHLLIANAFAENQPVLLNNPEYYLGVIAPDAIHARSDTITAREKYDTHLKPTGPDGLSEVIAYWVDQKRNPFHIGYGLHVITDRLWTRYYPFAFPSVMHESGGTRTEIYRPDAEWIDRTIYKQSPNAKHLLGLLQVAVPPVAHPYLTADEINTWRHMIIKAYSTNEALREDLPKAMTVEGTFLFIHYALEKLKAVVGGDAYLQ